MAQFQFSLKIGHIICTISEFYGLWNFLATFFHLNNFKSILSKVGQIWIRVIVFANDSPKLVLGTQVLITGRSGESFARFNTLVRMIMQTILTTF